MSEINTRALIKLRGVSQRFDERDENAATRWLRERNVLAAQAVTRAVEHVDLAITPGEMVGLVGESGCGKSTLGRIVSGLIAPTEGDVLVDGQDSAAMSPAALRTARLAIQMIFQDPYSSLNPQRRIRDIVGEALLIHGMVERSDLDAYVAAQLKQNAQASIRRSPTAIRMSSAAVSGSASGLRERSRSTLPCSSAMKQSPPSMYRYKRRS